MVAGVAALRRLDAAQMLAAAGIKEIAAEAGVSVPTVYHHFGNVEGYADAVVAHIYDLDRFPVADITDRIERVRASSLPVETAIEVHRQEFARLSNDPEHRIRLGLWALGGDGVDEPYSRFLREIDARVAAHMAAVFKSWGREMRPPFDITSFVAAELALLTGYVVRNAVDPVVADEQNFARTAVGLLAVSLRLEGDRRSLDDRLTEINYYPLHHSSGERVSDARDEARGRVLDAAAEHFGRVGREHVTVAQIARSANVGTSTLYRLFDSVDDIAVHLLLRQARDVFARKPPASGPADEMTTIARFLAARADHVVPYAERLATVGTEDGDPIVARAALAMRGDEDGSLVGVKPHDLERAEVAVLLVARRLLQQPAAGPGGAIAHLGTLGMLSN